MKGLWGILGASLMSMGAYGQMGKQVMAEFDGMDGISGYVMVYDGEIRVNISAGSFDPIPLGLASDCVNSIKYHVHMLWEHDDDGSRITENCSATYTGGHADPFAACGGATGNMACANKGGCVNYNDDDGYSYSCDLENDYYSCETGDWSGKYGTIDMDEDGYFIATLSSFGEMSGELLEGLSFVAHCGTGDADRVFCAPFRDTGMYEDGDDSTYQVQEDGLSMRVDFRNALGASRDANAYVEFKRNGDYAYMFDAGLLDGLCSNDEFEFVVYEHDWQSAYMSMSQGGEGETVCDDMHGTLVWDPSCQCYDGDRATSCDTCLEGKQCNDTMYAYPSTCDVADAMYGVQCSPFDLNGLHGPFVLSEAGSLMKSGFDRYLVDLMTVQGKTLGMRCAFAKNSQACGGFMSSGKATAMAMFSAEQNGIAGYVKVQDGKVDVNLDFSQVDVNDFPNTDCLTDGVKAHIHVRWDHGDMNDRIGSTDCGADFTGGHYDPWYGCGGATDNGLCAGKGGCMREGVTYDCDLSGDPFTCEVGDWSAKYGNYPVDSDMIMRSDGHFLEVDANDIAGMSVVFHCGNDGNRAFCAPFSIEGTDGNGAPPSYSQTGDSLRSVMASMSGASVAIYANGEYSVRLTDFDVSGCSGSDPIGFAIFNEDTCDTIFDPTLSCIEPTGHSMEICMSEVPCNDSSMAYACDYSMDPYSCAPADLSGKWGTFPYDDGNPQSDYMTGFDDLSLPLGDVSGKYVGFYCHGDDQRDMTQVCAAFMGADETTTPMPMPGVSSTEMDDSSSILFAPSFFILSLLLSLAFL